MTADNNIRTINSIYEAFGRDDVGAILEALTDDVNWATDTSSTTAPWYKVRHGKNEVADFFEAFGATVDVDEFTPLTFAGNQDSVLTVVRFRGRVRSTGKSVDMNLQHYFVFSDGKINYHRASEDTAIVEAALRADS